MVEFKQYVYRILNSSSFALRCLHERLGPQFDFLMEKEIDTER